MKKKKTKQKMNIPCDNESGGRVSRVVMINYDGHSEIVTIYDPVYDYCRATIVIFHNDSPTLQRSPIEQRWLNVLIFDRHFWVTL